MSGHLCWSDFDSRISPVQVGAPPTARGNAGASRSQWIQTTYAPVILGFPAKTRQSCRLCRVKDDLYYEQPHSRRRIFGNDAHHVAWRADRNSLKKVYPDVNEFWTDLTQAYGQEIRDLYDARCRI
jgi:hypothetical protein